MQTNVMHKYHSTGDCMPEKLKKGIGGKTDQLTERRRIAKWLKERDSEKQCMKGVKIIWKNK